MGGNLESVNRKYYLGAIRPMEWLNGQPLVAPGLTFNYNGSVIVFRDNKGNIKWIELRDGLFYECTPEDGNGKLLSSGNGGSGTSPIIPTSFKLTQSETKTDLQPAGYSVLNLLVTNNEASAVPIKLKQFNDNYIIGNEYAGKNIPAGASIFIQQFTNDQYFHATENKDLTFEITGSGKDVDVFMNFIKMI